MRLSVVLPAYREGDRIAATVTAVRSALEALDGGVEIVVVDDGSGDATAAEARAAGADQVIALATNEGKGAAVRAGVLAAHGRTVAFTDADLAYAPVQLLGLLQRVEEGADVVVGSRRHGDSVSHERTGRNRAIAGRAFSLLCRLLRLTDLSDTQCGIKAFRASAARDLFSHATIRGFAFDVEILYLARRAGYRVVEVPVEVVNSTRSSVRTGHHLTAVLGEVFGLRWRTLWRSTSRH